MHTWSKQAIIFRAGWGQEAGFGTRPPLWGEISCSRVRAGNPLIVQRPKLAKSFAATGPVRWAREATSASSRAASITKVMPKGVDSWMRRFPSIFECLEFRVLHGTIEKVSLKRQIDRRGQTDRGNGAMAGPGALFWSPDPLRLRRLTFGGCRCNLAGAVDSLKNQTWFTLLRT